ncbi:DNA polymerase Y family protein [Halobellus captivus]|uniref:DNA polymerase Y family protein n=1 Tax=Halobellus captivus TaxID=2592614 RepID=UPI0011A86C70|nr:DNA polymerase IV [Halobellus captivus]
MSEETLPGVETGTPSRIVLHVDMDCFYASCERLREPALRGEPVVVGMGYEDGETFGAVATASYEAREHGVESAQPISQALDRLPRARDDAEPGVPGGTGESAATDATDASTATNVGHYRPVDLDFYRSVASAVKEILHDCADVVREVSIDEAYLDVTDRTGWQRTPDDDRTLAEGYARYVKQRIAREVGVPASVGVAPNMSAAKIASDHDKPDGLVVVEPGDVRGFLRPLPVAAIHGVGPVTVDRLSEMGVDTAGDLADADPADLQATFGSRGVELHERARGTDDREVTPTGRPKSLSRESAFAEATADSGAKQETLAALADDVAARARDRDATYRTIGIKAVVPPYEINTRERSLSGPVDDPDLVESVALELLEEFDDVAVRKLGVRVSNLSFASGEQARLDGWDSADAAASRGSESRAESASVRRDGDTDTRARTERGQISLDDFDPDASTE